MRMALDDARLRPEDVGYINTHGTSTPQGDPAESQAIKAVFGKWAKAGLAISSTKSMTGHLLGAAGGVEAVLSVLALHSGILPPTINVEDQDPECDLDVVPNAAREQRVSAVLSNSFGFGGTNAVLALRRAAWDEAPPVPRGSRIPGVAKRGGHEAGRGPAREVLGQRCVVGAHVEIEPLRHPPEDGFPGRLVETAGTKVAPEPLEILLEQPVRGAVSAALRVGVGLHQRVFRREVDENLLPQDVERRKDTFSVPGQDPLAERLEASPEGAVLLVEERMADARVEAGHADMVGLRPRKGAGRGASLKGPAACDLSTEALPG